MRKSLHPSVLEADDAHSRESKRSRRVAQALCYGRRRAREEVKNTPVNLIHLSGLVGEYQQDWQRKVLLTPGASHSLTWQSTTGEQVAFLRIQAEPEWVLLRHRYKSRMEDWQEIEEVVPLTWTPCHFGGERPWFLCPGAVRGRYCGRRVAVL